MLNGKVTVFSGTLSDGQQTIAKLPATEAYLDREVENLKRIARWPELQNCVVLLRDIGRYDNQGLRMLILQPTLMTLAQAVETGFTTGTPLFMGWNVIRNKGHLVSTELESLFYVLIFVLAGGILPWRHTPFEDHNLAATVFGIMASDEFSARVLKRVPGSL
ncbi:hypothetical protein WJX77_010859 [Trebouxia sp. C0004]